MAAQQPNVGLLYAAHSTSGSPGGAQAAYAGPHLIAVADGAAGRRHYPDHVPDVIRDPSAEALAGAHVIDMLAPLDTEVPRHMLQPLLERAVEAANHSLLHLPPHAGTALTAMLWSQQSVALAHIGDSRGYMLRDGILYQITQDHTAGAMFDDDADQGGTPEPQQMSWLWRIVSQALDGKEGRSPDLTLRTSLPGDRHLLCSADLGALGPEEIFKALGGAADPETCVRLLIEAAARRGEPGDITFVVADVVLVGAEWMPSVDPIRVGAATGARWSPVALDDAGIRPVPQTAREPSPRPQTVRPAPTEPLPADQEEDEPAAGPANFTVDGYEVFEPLGAGGNATVYRGRRTALGRDVAIKVVERRIAGARDLRRFRREVDATVRLSEHPNVVTLYDADTLPDGRPYLVMELCPGGSLADRLRREGPLPPAEVRELGVQIADAVAAAHDHGVLHRDIKPANLLLTRFNRVALADFGIAALPVPGQDLSITLAMTPVYAAPEVFEDSPPSPAGDIYSLGATLYALLAGRAPRAPERNLSPAALIAHLLRMQDAPLPPLPGVPDALMAVLHKSLQANPSARYQSATDLRAALTSIRL